ncbi:MAG: hypothetical protein A3J09_01880 [Candidatus Zambryskibacteria bacterium RIFCSPLOWO2_02_FULL_51_21]|uniref:Uncharacterized protein n=1 Tax=Candidatus Zambryskibacteria bacterium RIFCSPHIGHO2_02_FULL_43_37 TaxID=1802749 RepID=A0A1G2TGM9_9BACT|nr:MAG: hypothetical protein A2723_01880 [Candidatus Zambryskibacteria bacterium RIFCSPHIGHO2_01_FULL_52_18]OHA96454.1 MAG: hypothetical protein A3D49_01020 [Candidatus Zambryskibacteria bacterium RIFCSPHIGHO2_02_FULL_43_37]OHB11285.1 MAG: hypothetical protein A3J09_01880 [Candidatus Zambryskibacteria bacterium RIFCSPLOWO2_02_FULL_51_21]
MADQWKDVGGNPYGMDIVSAAIDSLAGIDRVQVQDTSTGEYRDVEVHTREGQTLGEAIAEGQFRDK